MWERKTLGSYARGAGAKTRLQILWETELVTFLCFVKMQA